MKRYLKITAITTFICLILITALFFLAWSGSLGKRYHNISNELISRYLYPDHYFGREAKAEIIDHKEGCIGKCTVGNGIIEKFGMLEIRKSTDGCIGSCKKETKYRFKEFELIDDEYKYNSIVLKNPKIPEKYDELMVKIYGTIEEDAIEDFKTYDLITVEGYEVLSKVTYHRFLRDEKGRYTKEKYGCKVGWNSTFAWEYSNEQPILKARMVNTREGDYEGRFIELWYDGNTGEFIKEENNLGFKGPCEILRSKE